MKGTFRYDPFKSEASIGDTIHVTKLYLNNSTGVLCKSSIKGGKRLKGSGEEIGQLFKMCRTRSGLTQEQIAVQIKATQSVVSRIEAGQIIPDFYLAIRWAEVTDSGEFIALALTGAEGWKRLMRMELVFKRMQAMISEVGA